MPNKPNFLVIGVQKAATSWLWVQLRKHSQIWLPPIKELHFFDHLYVEENRNWTTGHIYKGVRECLKWQINHAEPFNPQYVRYIADYTKEDIFTEEWYFRIFSRSLEGRITGDITPEYCTIPEEGIQYVKQLLGDLPIVMIVRDPVKRALSQIRMNVSRQGINGADLSTEQWMEHTTEPALYNRAQYSQYLPLWEKHFQNILYIPYKHIAQQPQEVMTTLCSHLGIKDEEIQGLQDKVHVGEPAPVPAEVIAHFTKRFKAETDYLTEKFDPAFNRSI